MSSARRAVQALLGKPVQLAIRSGSTSLTLEVESYGVAERGTLLLVMGLGTQLIAWPMDLVQRLVEGGYRVIRFDNRDVGLSTKFDALGVPNAVHATLRRLLHLRVHAPYSLEDMARDAVGLLDALGIERAHVVGASMGGMIAEILAASHATRIASAALIMSSPGAPQPWDATAAARRVLLACAPADATLEQLIEMRVRTYEVIGGVNNSASREQLTELARRVVARSVDTAGSRRQLAATQKTGSLRRLCRDIRVPTLVLHGADDPLIHPRRARQLHALIPGSELLTLPGMGHNLPQPLLPAIAAAILRNCARAEP